MRKKKIELPVKDIYEKRIPISTCKNILRAKENGYSDEDVLLIRDFLYSLAIADYYITERRIKRKLRENELNTVNYDDTEKGNSLLQSEYRRAS